MVSLVLPLPPLQPQQSSHIETCVRWSNSPASTLPQFSGHSGQPSPSCGLSVAASFLPWDVAEEAGVGGAGPPCLSCSLFGSMLFLEHIGYAPSDSGLCTSSSGSLPKADFLPVFNSAYQCLNVRYILLIWLLSASSLRPKRAENFACIFRVLSQFLE